MKLFSIWSVRSSCLNESRISSDKGKFWLQIVRPLLMAGILVFVALLLTRPGRLFLDRTQRTERGKRDRREREKCDRRERESYGYIPSCLVLLVSGCIIKRNRFSTVLSCMVNLTSYFLYMVVLCIMRYWLRVGSRWLDIIIGKFFCAFLWNETKAIIVIISKKERAQYPVLTG